MSNFIKYNNDNISLKPDKKIIKAKDYATYLESKEIIRASEEQAKQQEEHATHALSGMIKEALSNANQRVQEEKATQMIATVAASLQHLQQVETRLVGLVMQCVRKVISDYSDEDLIAESVKQGLKQIGHSQQIHIRLHPDMAPSLQERLPELSEKLDFIHIRPDPQLGKDDCILESDMGIINTNIEQQLAAIEKVINHYFDVEGAEPEQANKP